MAINKDKKINKNVAKSVIYSLALIVMSLLSEYIKFFTQI